MKELDTTDATKKEFWKPTQNLRWYTMESGNYVLQQLWVSDQDQAEWRNVPVYQPNYEKDTEANMKILRDRNGKSKGKD